jgi:hypothetical protein
VFSASTSWAVAFPGRDQAEHFDVASAQPAGAFRSPRRAAPADPSSPRLRSARPMNTRLRVAS